MSLWYHRCPQKSTAKQSFRLNLQINDAEALKVLSDLKLAREKLMELLPDCRHDGKRVMTSFETYVSLIRGFLEIESGDGVIGVSKLRKGFLIFKWTQSMIPLNTANAKTAVFSSDDTLFEYSNMICSVGLWFMKHASLLTTSNREMSDDICKTVHTSLRQAAGLFKHLQDTVFPHISEKPQNGSDFDLRVISAYVNQCSGEAQEVTILRAINLNHNAKLIASLAHSTSKLFTTAADSLQSLPVSRFSKWNCYLRFKVSFYGGYAYGYSAVRLLNEDKCGEAIRSAQEGIACYKKCLTQLKEYSKTKCDVSGGGNGKLKVEQFLFFNKLQPFLQRTLEKCERENGLIYHHRVALDPPDFESTGGNDCKTFGLVSPLPFEMPAISSSWSPLAYASINVMTAASKLSSMNDKDSVLKPDDEQIKQVKEFEPKIDEIEV